MSSQNLFAPSVPGGLEASPAFPRQSAGKSPEELDAGFQAAMVWALLGRGENSPASQAISGSQGPTLEIGTAFPDFLPKNLTTRETCVETGNPLVKGADSSPEGEPRMVWMVSRLGLLQGMLTNPSQEFVGGMDSWDRGLAQVTDFFSQSQETGLQLTSEEGQTLANIVASLKSAKERGEGQSEIGNPAFGQSSMNRSVGPSNSSGLEQGNFFLKVTGHGPTGEEHTIGRHVANAQDNKLLFDQSFHGNWWSIQQSLAGPGKILDELVSPATPDDTSSPMQNLLLLPRVQAVQPELLIPDSALKDPRFPELPPAIKETVLAQTVRSMALTLKEGISEMRIHLKPDFLGHLSMKISVEDGLVTASFVVENQQVKELLESNLANLRQSLHSQGLKVENLSVGIAGGGPFSDLSRRQAHWGTKSTKDSTVGGDSREEKVAIPSAVYEGLSGWNRSSMDYVV